MFHDIHAWSFIYSTTNLSRSQTFTSGADIHSLFCTTRPGSTTQSQKKGFVNVLSSSWYDDVSGRRGLLESQQANDTRVICQLFYCLAEILEYPGPNTCVQFYGDSFPFPRQLSKNKMPGRITRKIGVTKNGAFKLLSPQNTRNTRKF